MIEPRCLIEGHRSGLLFQAGFDELLGCRNFSSRQTMMLARQLPEKLQIGFRFNLHRNLKEVDRRVALVLRPESLRRGHPPACGVWE
jgi:hypothetical protein